MSDKATGYQISALSGLACDHRDEIGPDLYDQIMRTAFALSREEADNLIDILRGES